MEITRFPMEKVPPSIGSSISHKQRVISSSFGDGYYQAARDGINTDISTINVVWPARRREDIDIIVNFLKPKLSIEPFLFKMTDQAKEELYICESLDENYVEYMGNGEAIKGISATFRKTYYIRGK